MSPTALQNLQTQKSISQVLDGCTTTAVPRGGVAPILVSHTWTRVSHLDPMVGVGETLYGWQQKKIDT